MSSSELNFKIRESPVPRVDLSFNDKSGYFSQISLPARSNFETCSQLHMQKTKAKIHQLQMSGSNKKSPIKSIQKQFQPEFEHYFLPSNRTEMKIPQFNSQLFQDIDSGNTYVLKSKVLPKISDKNGPYEVLKQQRNALERYSNQNVSFRGKTQILSKKDGSTMPIEYDGFGRCGIRSLKRGLPNDEEIMKKVNKYEQTRYASKFQLNYYDKGAATPKKTLPIKPQSPKKITVQQIVVPQLPLTSKIQKMPQIQKLNTSSSSNLLDVSVDDMSSLNRQIVKEVQKKTLRKSMQSLGSHRLPNDYSDMPKTDLIKIINQEDIKNVEPCPERARVKQIKQQAKIKQNIQKFIKYQKGDYEDEKPQKNGMRSILSSPQFNNSCLNMKSENSVSSLGYNNSPSKISFKDQQWIDHHNPQIVGKLGVRVSSQKKHVSRQILLKTDETKTLGTVESSEEEIVFSPPKPHLNSIKGKEFLDTQYEKGFFKPNGTNIKSFDDHHRSFQIDRNQKIQQMEFLRDQSIEIQLKQKLSQEQLLTYNLKQKAIKHRQDLISNREGPITKIIGREPVVPTTCELKALDDKMLLQNNKKFRDFKQMQKHQYKIQKLQHEMRKQRDYGGKQ